MYKVLFLVILAAVANASGDQPKIQPRVPPTEQQTDVSVQKLRTADFNLYAFFLQLSSSLQVMQILFVMIKSTLMIHAIFIFILQFFDAAKLTDEFIKLIMVAWGSQVILEERAQQNMLKF